MISIVQKTPMPPGKASTINHVSGEQQDSLSALAEEGGNKTRNSKFRTSHSRTGQAPGPSGRSYYRPAPGGASQLSVPPSPERVSELFFIHSKLV